MKFALKSPNELSSPNLSGFRKEIGAFLSLPRMHAISTFCLKIEHIITTFIFEFQQGVNVCAILSVQHDGVLARAPLTCLLHICDPSLSDYVENDMHLTVCFCRQYIEKWHSFCNMSVEIFLSLVNV